MQLNAMQLNAMWQQEGTYLAGQATKNLIPIGLATIVKRVPVSSLCSLEQGLYSPVGTFQPTGARVPTDPTTTPGHAHRPIDYLPPHTAACDLKKPAFPDSQRTAPLLRPPSRNCRYHLPVVHSTASLPGDRPLPNTLLPPTTPNPSLQHSHGCHPVVNQ